MKLGRLALKNNLILAPLQNVTTAPYRRFCRHFSPIGLVCVPMMYIKRIQTSPKSVLLELEKIEEERPVSIQIVGKDLGALEEAVLFLESYDFDVLDINAGCPSKRAIHGKYGGYLMKDLEHLDKMVTKAVKLSSKPVSLKIRTGFSKPVDIGQFSNIIDDSGLEFVTVHARTVKDRLDDEKLDLDFVRALKNKVNVPAVGNGDIFTPSDAKTFLNETNADGLMIGRGSIGYPELFSDVIAFLENNEYSPFKNSVNRMKERIMLYRTIVLEFLEGLKLPYSPEEYLFTELKRNAIWLTKDIPNSTILRKNLSKTRRLSQLESLIEEL